MIYYTVLIVSLLLNYYLLTKAGLFSIGLIIKAIGSSLELIKNKLKKEKK